MSRRKLDFRPGQLDLIGIRAWDRNVMRIRITSCGVPMDTTGADVMAQAREHATDPDPALRAEIEPVDETLGTYLVRWPGDLVADALDGQESRQVVWDLQVRFPGDVEPETLLAGAMQMESDVSRDPGQEVTP